MRHSVRPRLRTYQLQSLGWKGSVSELQRVFEDSIEAGSTWIPLRMIGKLLQKEIFEPLHLVRSANQIRQSSGPRINPAIDLILRLLPGRCQDPRILLRLVRRALLLFGFLVALSAGERNCSQTDRIDSANGQALAGRHQDRMELHPG